MPCGGGEAFVQAGATEESGVRGEESGAGTTTSSVSEAPCGVVGRRRGQIKIPKGSGTNLGFGGDREESLYITTWNALYAVELAK